MTLEKYSLGIGDRFGMEGVAQLRALQAGKGTGRDSSCRSGTNRTASTPSSGRNRRIRCGPSTAAVAAASWTDPFYLDADHIGLTTLDDFVGACNFFTIDVADMIGQASAPADAARFITAMSGFKGTLRIPGMGAPIIVDDALLDSVAGKYLRAVTEAGTDLPQHHIAS